MSTCSMCNTPLSFANKPLFYNKTCDGGTICTKCQSNLTKVNNFLISKIKTLSTAELINMVVTHQQEKENKKEAKNELIEHLKSLNLPTTDFLKFGMNEIKELPNILNTDEVIDNLVVGSFDDKKIGLLISTNRRLLFVDKGILYGLKVEDFPLKSITSIQYSTGILMGEIKIHCSGNTATITNVEKKSTRHFAEYVRNRLSQTTNDTPVIHTTPTDIYDQLEKLGKLKENGIITEEEFQQQKSKLLNQ